MAVTVEHEAVPVTSARIVAASCATVPAAHAPVVAGDRLRAKRMLRAVGVATTPFGEVLSAIDAVPASLFPGILKTARNGSEGRGQIDVGDAGALASAWRRLGAVACVLAQRVAWTSELSVLLARDRDGRMESYPVVENVHRGGILEFSLAPARVSPVIAAKAVAIAALIAESLDYVGVLAVEFFLVGNQLLVNEFALRPHHSGHFTLDACTTSQFEQHVRALTGQPLASSRMRHRAATVSVIDSVPRRDHASLASLATAFDACLHRYGNDGASRKIAHFTLLDEFAERAARRAEALREALHGAAPVATAA
jgi:5-(carboxyamino)imidazole ribonucleotide synthase